MHWNHNQLAFVLGLFLFFLFWGGFFVVCLLLFFNTQRPYSNFIYLF